METRAIKTGGNLEPDTPIQFLKGVGPRRAELLARLGVATVRDLLYLFPRRYLDARRVTALGSLTEPAREVTVAGTVTAARLMLARGKRIGFEAVLDDGTGKLTCRFFGRPFLHGQIESGQRWIMFGELERYQGKLFLSPLEYERLPEEGEARLGAAHGAAGIIPLYPLTEGLTQRALRLLTSEALKAAPRLEERLPEELRRQWKLMPRARAILALHRPEDPSQTSAAHRALAFEELFYLELMLLGRKHHIQRERRSRVYRRRNHLVRALGQALPFRLTEAQQQVLREIDQDLAGEHPLNRLVQGDVGSGKTMIAIFAALRAIENGYQAALMAPTEVLAEQHHRTLTRFLGALGIEPVLLLGKTPAAQRREALGKLASGEALLAVGTHALIQQGVEFSELGLVVVDEQHRFGVAQRLALRQKGRDTDLLVMTATPIPRSLALTLYGDLDVSVIDRLPAGRKPISTHLVPPGRRADLQRFLAQRIEAGERVFVVCPRIEASEEEDAPGAAEEWFARYRDQILPQFRVVLLHGRLPCAEKERAMRAFESGEAQVLVGTTVIEVGVDVPAATVMVIEGAERFGLSQLHQLRGRVGRGERQSWCFLLPGPGVGRDSLERLRIIAATTDGFKISEEDLRLRGPGDFFGERQSGLPELRVADLVEDYQLLLEARAAAEAILRADSWLELPEHRILRQELVLRYRDRLEFLRIG